MLALGTILDGAYELRSLLGSGGMAQVFDAHDGKLDRRVAVKVARPEMAEALRAEGRALAAVRHSSVVAVFHAGVHSGASYLVLEHIAGSSLRNRLDGLWREGTLLPIDAVLTLFGAVAQALSVVHEAGLSHRDLKPENVMLAPRDRIVLMDFGLMRPEFFGSDEFVSGSPNYMAPEVIARNVRRGEGHLVDLYALGVLAYELLVGRTPFEHEQWRETLRGHLATAPVDPREHRPDVPSAVAQLVLALLAKRPHDRPESAELIAWSLRGAPSRACPR